MRAFAWGLLSFCFAKQREKHGADLAAWVRSRRNARGLSVFLRHTHTNKSCFGKRPKEYAPATQQWKTMKTIRQVLDSSTLEGDSSSAGYYECPVAGEAYSAAYLCHPWRPNVMETLSDTRANSRALVHTCARGLSGLEPTDGIGERERETVREKDTEETDETLAKELARDYRE